MNQWLNLAMILEPGIFKLVMDIRAMAAKHPTLADPAAQQAFIAAVVGAAATVDDAAAAKWAADKAAHGG